MTTVEALIQLRDDIKKWVTINLNAIGKPKASDIKIDAIDGMDATTAQGALEELNSNMGSKMSLLWENPSVGTDLTGETLSLNSDDYELLLVIAQWSTTDTGSILGGGVKGSSIIISTNSIAGTSAAIIRRVLTYVSDTEYVVGDIITTNSSAYAKGLQPYRIYGIKS